MQGKKEEKKTLYALYILRRDGEHIQVTESTNYDNVFEKYKAAKSLWTSCIKNNEPFELTNPIVTSFDPGLIFEITIRPIIEQSSSRFDNPYQQEMVKKGLSNTIRNSPEILDGGYK